LIAAATWTSDARAQRSCADKRAESWEITIAGAKEKGDRLVVEGVVTDANGKPVAGAIVYAYQTDADGYYIREKNSNDARLCGYMKTDADGRYRIHSILPGSYPGSTIAAHIHYVVSGANVVEESFLLEFEGDRFVTQQSLERDRSRHQGLAESYRGIRPLEKRDDGSLYCRRDLRVDTR
jgi:protocatechuate 3,4-dioxygenase beta subunit